MYKVTFYREEGDALPISMIIEAEDEEVAKDEVRFLYDKPVFVSVVAL